MGCILWGSSQGYSPIPAASLLLLTTGRGWGEKGGKEREKKACAWELPLTCEKPSLPCSCWFFLQLSMKSFQSSWTRKPCQNCGSLFQTGCGPWHSSASERNRRLVGS